EASRGRRPSPNWTSARCTAAGSTPCVRRRSSPIGDLLELAARGAGSTRGLVKGRSARVQALDGAARARQVTEDESRTETPTRPAAGNNRRQWARAISEVMGMAVDGGGCKARAISPATDGNLTATRKFNS